MNLKTQKRLAAQIMKVGETRVWFDPGRLDEIKEAITKADLKPLIKNEAIKKKPEKGISRFRARKRQTQRKKGRQQNTGSRKGKRTSRLSGKQEWMNRLRAQRKLIFTLRETASITNDTFKILYKKAKGGFFRSRSHIMLYLKENKLLAERKNGKK
jgi:large subunit ribosomal protein L19e